MGLNFHYAPYRLPWAAALVSLPSKTVESATPVASPLDVAVINGPAPLMPAPDARARPATLGLMMGLALLTLVGGWLRFTATSFGWPDHYRPDEEYMISRALDFQNDWNPHFALYPAAQMYVQHAALWGYGALTGHRHDFRAAYGADAQALAYLVARRVSAAMGTATIPVIYLTAAYGFGIPAGLSAAAILAFATLAVRESKFATTDSATVLWLTLALWFVFRMARRGQLADYVAAGALTGLAVATKYPAGALVGGLIVAHFEARAAHGQSWLGGLISPRLYFMGLVCFLVFFCSTPYFFLDWARTVADFNYQRGYILYGVPNAQAGYGWGWLWLHAMPDSLSWPLLALLALAMAWAVLRPRPGTWALMAFIWLTFLGMTQSHYVFYRYVMIPLPAMVILAGGFVAAVLARLQMWVGTHRAVAAIVLALAVLLSPAAIRDVQLDRLLGRCDTRSLAHQWIDAHVPPGSVIAATAPTTPYGKPPLEWGRYQIVPFVNLAFARAQGARWVMSDSFPPLAYYSPGPTPVQLVELNRHAMLRLDENPLVAGAPTPVFDPNDAFYAPLVHIDSMTRPGPRVRIWQLN